MGPQDQWRSFWERARAANILEVARFACKASLKKQGTYEWAGPCPACGGDDRFAINTSKRVFNCRGSEDGGDVISMVKHVLGCSLVEAAERITGETRPDRSRDESDEERAERLKEVERRSYELRKLREEEQREAALRARRTEESVQRILSRAVPIKGTHAEAYMWERGLRNVPPRLTSDLRFVADLDYWGFGETGAGDVVHLDTTPALIAIIRDFSGAIIGISQTYLHATEPKKWTPVGSFRNSAKKVRGEKKNGMIRLGITGEHLALSEGWENALAWWLLGRGAEGITLGAAVDLQNMAGGAMGTAAHKIRRNADGQPWRIQNGVPNMAEPGVILPEGVRYITLVCDGDSDYCRTVAMMRTAGLRYRAQGLEVTVDFSPVGRDWNQVLLGELAMPAPTAPPPEIMEAGNAGRAYAS